MDSFQKRKQDVLSKLDKSHIGKWDEKIAELCDKINSLENYYTTSSCSGRIILMIDAEKKGKDLFVFVSHDKVSFEELKNELSLALDKNLKVKFKLEPCIIHINCKTLEDAEKICDKGKLAGWKKSGIIGMKNGITVELNSTEKLEFPIIRNKKILVDDDFLKIAVDEANKKLEKVWVKIEKLEGMIK
ncbi:MAG: tRNA wybutosine-synthesizing 3 family protein [Candidatus Nanoarchaeia archaeon]|nr:tRNA wybutosine-synthesizing 3 family protein [Candidatus Nanoarchaeia archaeon]MDD5358002.1 tRNA wybutosine-synthesizing 3 family protein [Candidatus Nanoarchaeia archaeon]MDD5588921.1 tRNA wybutosine-synthesizing 3 family protein [Candidatus Nanoarchaeia archaeon]